MDSYFTVDGLQKCAWEISEVIRTSPRCPHASQRRQNKGTNELCRTCLSIQTKLGMISFQLESDPGAVFDPDIEERALEIWKILEDMCSVSHRLCKHYVWKSRLLTSFGQWSRPFNTTHGLIRQGKQPFTSLLMLVEDESHYKTLHSNIMSYLRQPSFVVQGLIAKCEELSAKLQTDDSEGVIEIPQPESHCRAHKELFHVLSEYTVCESCPLSSGPKGITSSHPTRLYLTGPTKSEDDLVGFDIIVSSVDSKSWQDLYIKVSTYVCIFKKIGVVA